MEISEWSFPRNMIDPLVNLQNYMENQNHHFFLGKSTMASFHSYVNVYQRLLQWWISRMKNPLDMKAMGKSITRPGND